MDHHRRLDSELDVLRDRVLVLGGEAETALGRSMHALAERDSVAAREVLDAFTQGDASAARRVIERDDEIDVMYERLFHDLIGLMVSEPATTPRAARLLFVAKHLERVADYVTDICELTVYMAEAAFIKHSY